MKIREDLRIRGDVMLVQLRLEHAAATLEWVQIPSIRDNLGLRTEPSSSKTTDWIRNASQDPSIKAFAILCDGMHVGNVILDRIDSYLRSARIHIYIGINRGGGIGRTAIYLAASDGFESLKLHKIWATIHQRNIPSLRAFSAAGFQTEGILRDEFIWHNQFAAVFYMALFETDLEGLRVIIENESPARGHHLPVARTVVE